MKRKCICLIAFAISAASCMKEETPVPLPENDQLVASIEQMATSKTFIDEDRNVLWSAGDQISAFMKSTIMKQYKVADESVGKPSARFTRVPQPESDDLFAGTTLEHNVVYYPYQEDLQCMMSDGNYTMSLSLPAVQTYQEGSFGSGAFPMVAISDNNEIVFKNLCGGIRFQFTGVMKVASLEVFGADGEKLSGSATVTAYSDGSFPSIAGLRMDGVALYRNQIASYWTSTPYTAEMSKYLAFDISGYSAQSSDSANRAIAMSVRCVLITD